MLGVDLVEYLDYHDSGMTGWDAVSDWAESHPELAEAILGCTQRNIIGLPYGSDEVADVTGAVET